MKKISLWVGLLLFFMTVACSGSDNISDNISDDEGVSIKIDAPNFTTQSSYTNSIVVNWEENSGTTKYEIRYANKKDMSGAMTKPTNESSIQIKDLEKGTSYFFQVRTGVKSDWSAWSNVKKINTASFEAAVTTYNILNEMYDSKVGPEWNWNVRKKALQTMILQENNNADIIGFQEVFLSAEEVKQMIDETYDSHISKRDEVSARVISWKSEKFKLVDYDDDIDIFGAEVSGKVGARHVGHVRLREIETGKEILVYSVHVPASSGAPGSAAQRVKNIAGQNLAVYAKQ